MTKSGKARRVPVANRILPPVLACAEGADPRRRFDWQSLQAAIILIAVPIAFVFHLVLARFISGFTMGAVNG